MTILMNAVVVTGDAADRWYADGVVVAAGGKIAWIGSRSEWEASPFAIRRTDEKGIDLRGALVIPGLINTHSHAGLSALRGLCDDGDFFQWAKSIAPFTGALTDEQIRVGCRMAIREQLSNGITCTCDCSRFDPSIFMEEARRFGLRSMAGCLPSSPQLRPAPRQNWPDAISWTEASLRRWGGDPLSRTFLGAHSPNTCTDELILEAKDLTRTLGIDFVIHVAETQREVADSVSAYHETPVERLDRLGVLDDKTLIVHAVWVSEHDCCILKERGVRIAHCPTSNAKLGDGIAPVPTLRRASLAVGLGTDSMLSQNSQNLLEEAKWSVLLQRARAADGTILSARDAFAMATIGGAAALNWQDEIGSLEPGKDADLIALRRGSFPDISLDRIISDVVYSSGPRDVFLTMVAGEIVYENGRFPLAGASS